jgi:hypothetical protein
MLIIKVKRYDGRIGAILFSNRLVGKSKLAKELAG